MEIRAVLKYMAFPLLPCTVSLSRIFYRVVRPGINSRMHNMTGLRILRFEIRRLSTIRTRLRIWIRSRPKHRRRSPALRRHPISDPENERFGVPESRHGDQ